MRLRLACMGRSFLSVPRPRQLQLRGATFALWLLARARQIARRAGGRLSGLVGAGEGFLDLAHVPADGVETGENRLLERPAGRQAASRS